MSANVKTLKKAPLSKKLYDQRFLIFMSFPFIIWVVIFRYLPLFGWLMAFQDYKLGANILTTPLVGFKHFAALLQDDTFWHAMRNTLAMSGLGLLAGYTIPIIFALLLNEIRQVKFKKTVQTISYLPHFISWVVAANILKTMLSSEGPVNALLMSLNIVSNPIAFWGIPKAFWAMVTVSDVWKETGWNAIIYLAAISGVDQELYEAADVDGAGRFRKMWNITLPSIMPVIVTLLIMNIGWIISIGMEKQFLLESPIVSEYSTVIDLYVLKYGIGLSKYSYATAVGVFKSVVSIILLFAANTLSKRVDNGSIV